ncbi:MAG: autoinducer 2 ABC transporter substrate-binding protein [Treponema sp.]|jgi:simple sugar transport system substrate-binding protein/rhamnose transport system substrate-binding protein|nr:autoinducer 2 ABC transporter substrate-binding protein [Treponema sp.]
MKKLIVLALVALIVSGGALWAVGDAQGGAKKSGVPTIVIMPKFLGLPYFNVSEVGVKQAAQDIGVNVIFTGPATADAAEQVRMIEDLISKGVDAIAVAPNDAAALAPVMRRAKQAGILVMDWDTSMDPSVIDLSVHQVDDDGYAEHMWDVLAEGMGGSGDYAILTGGLSATTLNNWIDHGTAYAKKKYPNMNLVTERIPTDDKTQVAYQKSLDLITTYPNLKGIVCISSATPHGAAQAVQEKGLIGKITVVGTATPSDAGPFLEDGSLYRAILWDPSKLGYLTVILANDMLQGKKPVDGQNVPKIGKISVKPDGKTVIMGPPSDFTKENYKSFGF